MLFWSAGQLHPWPLSKLQPPVPEALTASATPTIPVESVAVSPAWPADPTLFAVWTEPEKLDFDSPNRQSRYECGYPGLAYISTDAGRQWSRPGGGLAGSCGLSAPLAVSPNYTRDQTLLTGVAGLGIFKSSDGGRLWLSSGAGLRDMTAREILLSLGFPHDQTAFVRTQYRYGAIYRSCDGGQSWQPLELPADLRPTALAISPNFSQDRLLFLGTATGQVLSWVAPE